MVPFNDIESYYASLWGKPSRVMKFRGAGQKIRVLKWDKGSTDEGVALYATVGASYGNQGDPHRVEFILGVDPEDDRMAMSLSALATFPPANGPVGKGETVTLADPVIPGSPMRSYLIIPEVREFIPPLKLKHTHVEFLRVMPMHPSELDLKKQFGAAWLMRNLHAQKLDLTDPARPAVTA